MTNLERILKEQHSSSVSHFAGLACFKYGQLQEMCMEECENCRFSKIANGRAYCDHKKKMEWLDSEADKEENK